jgi:hypothetical protein
MHTFKRIRYGQNNIGGLSENKVDPSIKKENVQPNKPNPEITSVLKPEEKPKVQKQDGPGGPTEAPMRGSIKKTVKISDDGFLKSTRDHFTMRKIAFGEELKFLIDNPDQREDRIRLGDLKIALSSEGIFKLP